jgi:hypothetical protein
MNGPADNSAGQTPPKLPPPLTDAAEAARLGLTLEVYLRLKRQSNTGNVEADLRAMTAAATQRGEQAGDDIAQEEAEYNAMWRRGGVFKRRNSAPGFISTAMRTPGEVAKMVLFLLAFFVQLAFLGIWLSNHRKVELGALWFFILGGLVISSMIITSLVWRALGERVREAIRWAVRFWPITFPLLLFVGISVVRYLFGTPKP